MFYLMMSDQASKSAARTLRAWTGAMRSWNAAYARSAELNTQAAGVFTSAIGGRGAVFDVVDPKWTTETAGLYARAFTDTVRAANESWGAFASLGTFQVEGNPFGLTGLFTSAMPSSTAIRASDEGEAQAAKTATADAKPNSTFLQNAIGEPDDLTEIKGIGPKLRDGLHELGIFHFWQIASLSANEKDWVSEQLGFKGRIEREQWVEQARELIEHV